PAPPSRNGPPPLPADLGGRCTRRAPRRRGRVSVSYARHHGNWAMSELSYQDEAASTYDRAFAHVSMHFLPFLLRAARLEPGQRVLDVATGTGIAAEAALAVVGPGGHVTAVDVSQAMVDRARQRLARSATHL